MIPVLLKPSHDEFLEASQHYKQPVIIDGWMDDWPDVWSLDWLAEQDGDRLHSIESYASGNRQQRFKYVRMTVADFVARLRAGETSNWYLAAHGIDAAFPELAPMVGNPLYIEEDGLEAKIRIRAIFFGVNSRTPMHYHPQDHACLVQLAGEKHFLFYPPGNLRKMQAPRFFASRFEESKIVVPEDADVSESFETVVGSAPIPVTVKEGQMLYIPVGWWHHVDGIGESLSVTVFHKAPLRDWIWPGPGLRDLAAVGTGVVRRAIRRTTTALHLARPATALAAKLGIVEDADEALEQHAGLYEYEQLEKERSKQESGARARP